MEGASRVRRTPLTEQDLEDIWFFVAQDNSDAADQLLDKIEESIKLLAGNPYFGPARPIAVRCPASTVAKLLGSLARRPSGRDRPTVRRATRVVLPLPPFYEVTTIVFKKTAFHAACKT